MIELFVGTHFQPMTFIIDTGSTWSWLTSEDCRVCPGNHYQYHKSTDFKSYDVVESIKYMKGKVSGKVVHDSVSLTPILSSGAR